MFLLRTSPAGSALESLPSGAGSTASLGPPRGWHRARRDRVVARRSRWEACVWVPCPSWALAGYTASACKTTARLRTVRGVAGERERRWRSAPATGAWDTSYRPVVHSLPTLSRHACAVVRKIRLCRLKSAGVWSHLRRCVPAGRIERERGLAAACALLGSRGAGERGGVACPRKRGPAPPAWPALPHKTAPGPSAAGPPAAPPAPVPGCTRPAAAAPLPPRDAGAPPPRVGGGIMSNSAERPVRRSWAATRRRRRGRPARPSRAGGASGDGGAVAGCRGYADPP
jgi:hypothetical protein